MGEPAKAQNGGNAYRRGAHLPDEHESAWRSGSDAGLPRFRLRVGDGTIDPATLPRVPRTNQPRTLTRDEYYQWTSPPVRRTPKYAGYVSFCQNPNCGRRRECVVPDGNDGWKSEPERFIRGRCQACYSYFSRNKTERPHHLMLEERHKRARRQGPEWREWEKQRESAYRQELDCDADLWDGLCANGHWVHELDSAGRCPSCRRHFYKHGRERAFDNDAFAAGKADLEDEADACGIEEYALELLLDTNAPDGLDAEHVGVYAYLRGPLYGDARGKALRCEDREILAWLTSSENEPQENDNDPEDDDIGDGLGLEDLDGFSPV